jgi:hypothetical protein
MSRIQEKEGGLQRREDAGETGTLKFVIRKAGENSRAHLPVRPKIQNF